MTLSTEGRNIVSAAASTYHYYVRMYRSTSTGVNDVGDLLLAHGTRSSGNSVTEPYDCLVCKLSQLISVSWTDK